MTSGGGAAMLQAGAAIALWGLLAWLGLRLKHVPPFLLVGCALLIGSLCSVHRLPEWRVRPAVLLLGVYGLFGFHFFLFIALRMAPPLEANLVNYLWPLLIVLLAPLVDAKQRLGARHVIAALSGFAGTVLLLGGAAGWEPASLSARAWIGYGCAFISAVIWSTYSLLTRRAGNFSSAAVGLFCLVSGLAALACHALLEPGYGFVSGDWPYLLLLGLGPMGLAFFLWDSALKRGDPRGLGALSYLTPLISTGVLAAAGEGRLSVTVVAAVMLIVFGAIAGNLAGRG